MEGIREQDEVYVNHSGEVVKFVGYGTVIAFIVAWLMHAIGDAIGGSFLIDGIFPNNESIWNHMKLAFYPSLIVTLVPWCEYVKRIEFKKRCVMATIAAFMSQFIVAMGYYGLRFGFNIEGMITNFVLLFVALLFGFIHAAMISDDHIYQWVRWLGVAYVVGMVGLYYIFAAVTPALPIFTALD